MFKKAKQMAPLAFDSDGFVITGPGWGGSED